MDGTKSAPFQTIHRKTVGLPLAQVIRANALTIIFFMAIGTEDSVAQDKPEQDRNMCKYGAEHKNKIEALAQNKIRLFSDVSHELRTPLQLIMSELGNSKKSELEEETLNISALVHNVQRMENLLDQVNTVDKLGTSTLENFRLYSVDDIKIIASSLDSLVKTKRQVLDVSTRGTGTISLLKGSLESIIGNLITNAVKFTENNGIIKFSAVFDEDNLIGWFLSEKQAHNNQPLLFSLFLKFLQWLQ